MTVTVICEECGKTYHIPVKRLEQVQGQAARTRCKQCGHILTIEKPSAPAPAFEETIEEPAPESDADMPAPPPPPEPEAPEPAPAEAVPPDPEPPRPKRSKPSASSGVKTKGLGLRSKMILLFLVVPLVFMAAFGYLAQRRMNALSASITEESAAIITQTVEDGVASTARAAAKECQLYMANNPSLTPEQFGADPLLKELAGQKVGKTGYTSLYSVGPFTTWVHPNPKIIGSPIAEPMKKALGSDYGQFGRIIAAAEKGKNIENRGYYLWKDADGVKREKFMVITPIRGTRYGIAATAYLQEFTQPMEKLKKRSMQAAVETRNFNFITMIVTCIVIGIIVSLYGHRLTNNIKHLTDVADRISVGELDAEIQIRSADEIGSLADAISRMQDSLRLSIMRLRRKR